MNNYEVTVNQALNLAVQAYQQNDGKYIKDGSGLLSNKTIMMELLAKKILINLIMTVW